MRQKFKTSFKRTQNFLNDAYRFVLKIVNPAIFTLSTVGVIIAIYDFGFFHSDEDTKLANAITVLLLQVFTVLFILRFILISLTQKLWRLAFLDIGFAIFAFFLSGITMEKIEFELAWLQQVLQSDALRWVFFIVIFFFEIGRQSLNLNKLNLRPEQLFIFSFLILILIGTGLLMLPRSTYEGIRFIDALFTATSAVCVTGLIVVDTATYFTPIGQWVIFTLFQLGGIGIMTFTSFFGLFQKGGASFQSQSILKDITNSDKMGEVFKTVAKIVLITFIIELIGFVALLSTTSADLFDTKTDWVLYAIYHSVSSYCNAGFTLFSDGFADPRFAFNYGMQITVMFLIFSGALGFPIIFNYYQLFKHRLQNILRTKIYHKSKRVKTNIININSLLSMRVSLMLLFFGAAVFFILEYNNAFAEHGFFGKVVTAFFSSVTPRSGGLNTIDYNLVGMPSIMILLLLMWIGASPYSTGGGIRVNTFAVALLNVKSLMLGQSRMDTHYRTIGQSTIQKAFIVIFLSFLFIGLGVFLITWFDPKIELKKVIFDCFSAFGTVGLSLGGTFEMSPSSKAVITAMMFFGRMGMITLFMSFINARQKYRYSYPQENLMIT